MKTWVSYAMVFGIFASFMAATNPSKEDYLQRIVQRLPEEICTHEQLPPEFKTACDRAVPWVSGAISPLLARATRRQNYLLFSIYITELGCLKYHSIGLGSQFLQF
jgi:Domain of unknown function (DUF4359)